MGAGGSFYIVEIGSPLLYGLSLPRQSGLLGAYQHTTVQGPHLLAPLEASGFKFPDQSWALGGVAFARNPLTSTACHRLKPKRFPRAVQPQPQPVFPAAS